MSVDVLIVGQGLAGSLLAWELRRQGFSVVVVDNGAENASQVAAGLINPVTGQRLVKTQRVDDLLPAARSCYRELGAGFKQEFFVSLPMSRLLKNAKERQLAEQRLRDPAYQDYLLAINDNETGWYSPHGVLKQRQTGYLRTRPLLRCLREFFIANGCYRQANFEYVNITLQPTLQWCDVQARHVVFCEGHLAGSNPWFGKLPFQPAKGEILACQTMANLPANMLNYGYWLVPDREQGFKTGATFETDFTDSRPSDRAKTRLLDALHQHCPQLSPLELVEHAVGIRPATLDKQPFIGTHPRLANMHIFNGFGAKGSLAIPWYAKRFAAYLKQQEPLPEHCNIKRYHDTHFAG